MDHSFRIPFPGCLIGHADDPLGLTGTTVIRFDTGATCAVDVRGAAPGTRETDLLKPENLIEKVHAIVLSGGSVFGLESMTGVTRFLSEKGIGFDTGVRPVPIVTGAVLFDLKIGDPMAHPTAQMGYSAAEAAVDISTQGNCGAGMGCSVAKAQGFEHAIKSGLGIAKLSLDGDIHVMAIVALNAWGDILKGNDPVAAPFDTNGQMIKSADRILAAGRSTGFPAQNTTIGAIITNASLNKSRALKIAQMTHDGYARAINPVHTLFDGDTIFCASTDEHPFEDTNTLGIMAAEAMQEAIYSAISQATSVEGCLAIADLPTHTTQRMP